jgi:hypothetical protein
LHDATSPTASSVAATGDDAAPADAVESASTSSSAAARRTATG